MNRKKKQDLNSVDGDLSESSGDIQDEDRVWEEDEWSGEPSDRPARKGKARGREKDTRAAPRRRSVDDDLMD